jgi:hypothetical protein
MRKYRSFVSKGRIAVAEPKMELDSGPGWLPGPRFEED